MVMAGLRSVKIAKLSWKCRHSEVLVLVEANSSIPCVHTL